MSFIKGNDKYNNWEIFDSDYKKIGFLSVNIKVKATGNAGGSLPFIVTPGTPIGEKSLNKSSTYFSNEEPYLFMVSSIVGIAIFYPQPIYQTLREKRRLLQHSVDQES